MNQYFDAFDYFTKRTTTTKAQDNQNQFGASIGGPIVRNKSFFFFNYDSTTFSRTGASTDSNDSYDARIGWTPTSADTIFGRFNYFNRTRDIPGYLGGIADGTSTSAWGNQILKGASAVLGWTRVISPRMVNDFRFG